MSTLSVLLLAHSGHWALWVLYAIPVLAVLGVILAGSMRARRQQREAGADEDTEQGGGAG